MKEDPEQDKIEFLKQRLREGAVGAVSGGPWGPHKFDRIELVSDGLFGDIEVFDSSGKKMMFDGEKWVEEVKLPHAVSIANQYADKSEYSEGNYKHHELTGKVLVYCNCGLNTGWVDRSTLDFEELKKNHTNA